ncbi:hypothetical protein QZM18_07845 [Burkholderia diffusa]|uniref:hypothetical protein n=1 Tax=Burkholderia diffusa TaxID=488732 RepID=UPI00264F05F9|nr:hypothetical protein [Burkholderia diffusa]MDN7904040.1 hypothetical protein [Burkholderia diffusa]
MAHRLLVSRGRACPHAFERRRKDGKIDTTNPAGEAACAERVGVHAALLDRTSRPVADALGSAERGFATAGIAVTGSH